MRSSARLLTAVTLAVLTGCGVPTGGEPDTLAPSEVPYGLLSPAAPPPAPSSSPAQIDRPRVYLIGPDDVLRPSGRDVEGTGLRDRLGDLLRQLGSGPTAGERDDELATALPPGVRLSVAAVDDGTVTIDLAGPGEAPSGEQSRLAVGQIVLTATSLPDVHAVLLTRGGEPLEAPLPSGELTTAPLTAAEYQELLVAPPS
jgi:hypothetical protein